MNINYKHAKVMEELANSLKYGNTRNLTWMGNSFKYFNTTVYLHDDKKHVEVGGKRYTVKQALKYLLGMGIV